jgi:hypothetical protein
MFYITEKLDPRGGQFAFNPLQVASSWEEGLELIASEAEADPANVSLGVINLDAAGNVFRFCSVATPIGFSEYRITQLRRS